MQPCHLPGTYDAEVSQFLLAMMLAVKYISGSEGYCMVVYLHHRHIGSRGCMLHRGAEIVYDCFQVYGPGMIIIHCEVPVSTFCGTGAI